MCTRFLVPALGILGLGIPLGMLTAPTDIQLPGTQPLEVGTLQQASQCDNCHGGYDPLSEPAFGWRGGMMAHAGRDPLFWATLAVAERDFPQSGDLCLRCHTPRGWLEGRSTATDGSLMTAGDADGVECAICHQLVDPDGSEHAGVQLAPYLAHDGAMPPEGWHGSGMMVMAGGNIRLGPYYQTSARHAFAGSAFHRDSALCGTCHDVSNPVTGDIAHNHGAPLPLPPGAYSGVPGAPVADKAAFKNAPYRYGVVERTFSEHQASAFRTLRVRDYATLPAELQRGVLAEAHARAQLAGRQGDHEDGTTRLFSCQTCHMMPTTGHGASQNNAPLRRDLPQHDLTGGNTWLPDLIRWANQNNRLRLGGGMTTLQLNAIDAGKLRARANLRMAAALDVRGDTLHVVNLTGHKLISGYPEGRRMWLRTTWRDAQGNVLRTDGAYGPVTAQVAGAPVTVHTLLDPYDPNLRIYHAEYGITQEWAAQLLALGWQASTPVEYDRTNGAVTRTLGQVAAQAPGTAHHSFHFVLNNTVLKDTRIPPYGLAHDTARERNLLPVPATQFGNPGPGGTYRHRDEVALAPPTGAVQAGIELLYQPTSWEYVQFLLLANPRTNPFLANLGQDLYDGWRATGMAAPEVMATARWCGLPGTADDLRLRSAVGTAVPDTTCAKDVAAGQLVRFELASPANTLVGSLAVIAFELYRADGAMPQPLLPGIQLDRIDGQVPVLSLPAAGATTQLTIPPGMAGTVLRVQGIAIAPGAANGTYAATAAHDVLLR